MTMKKIGSVLLFLPLCWLLLRSVLYSQEAAKQQEQQQSMTLADYSYNIKMKLIDLKKNSAIVTEQLKTLSESLEQSQAEAQAWKDQSTTLSASLKSINEELNDSYKTITQYEQELETRNRKLKSRAKIITILIIILVIRIALMLLGYFLYWKGIKLPRWLDILL